MSALADRPRANATFQRRAPTLPMAGIMAAACAALAAELAAVPGVRAERADSVAVAAGADKDYVRQKFGDHGANPKAETYVFAQGNHFGGLLRDASLEHAQFTDIARVLAPDLAIQRYFPSQDARNADLIIVVHWGITYIEEDASHGQLDLDRLQADIGSRNLAIAKSGIADPGQVDTDLEFTRDKSAQSSNWPEYNAQLLGYTSEFMKEEYRSVAVASGMTETDRRLREDLMEDERYFVILMAYDLSSVKAGAKGVRPRLLWSNHFSMRAVGHNFATALPAMSRVAANYFGRDVDGLLLDAQRIPDGFVRMGEPKAVEPEGRK